MPLWQVSVVFHKCSDMLASHYYEGKIEAGCDEAGRGCLAGSVYAAAVILPEGYQNELLNDSKQLSEKKRYQLREIIERDAVAWAVGIVTPDEIDQINILNASILAMHRALDQLKVRPEAIIVDGNRFKSYQDLPHTTIVKGDGKYLAIALNDGGMRQLLTIDGILIRLEAITINDDRLRAHL